MNLEVDVIGKYVERLLVRPDTLHAMPALAETTRTAPFATIEEAIEDIRNGKFVVVCDAPDRENEAT